MPSPYRATQKTVKALELVVRYLNSAISRADDDSALGETKDTLQVVKAIMQAAVDLEAATRQTSATETSTPPEAAPAAPEAGDATDDADAAEIARQAEAMAAAIDAQLDAADAAA
jgi:indole-3-glycerol phosphate synthase